MEYQLTKVTAMEGRWNTVLPPPLTLFAMPEQKEQRNAAAIDIPDLGSLILTHSPRGPYQSFQAMVGERSDAHAAGIRFSAVGMTFAVDRDASQQNQHLYPRPPPGHRLEHLAGNQRAKTTLLSRNSTQGRGSAQRPCGMGTNDSEQRLER